MDNAKTAEEATKLVLAESMQEYRRLAMDYLSGCTDEQLRRFHQFLQRILGDGETVASRLAHRAVLRGALAAEINARELAGLIGRHRCYYMNCKANTSLLEPPPTIERWHREGNRETLIHLCEECAKRYDATH